MTISTLAHCPGSDRLETGDLVEMFKLEHNRADVHRTYLHGMNSIYLNFKKLKECQYVYSGAHKSEMHRVVAASTESIQGLATIIKETLSSLVSFIRELLTKLWNFFNQIFNKTTELSKVTQANIVLIDKKLAEDPRKKIAMSAIEIAPAAKYSEYTNFAKNVLTLVRYFENFGDKEKLERTADYLLNILEEGDASTGSNHRVHEFKFLLRTDIVNTAREIGLTFPSLHGLDDAESNEKIILTSVYGSTFKEKLSMNSPATFGNLGYNQENLKQILNAYVIPLTSYQGMLKDKLEFLTQLKKKCEIRLDQFKNNPKLMESLNKGNSPYHKIKQLTKLIATISAYMMLSTKLCTAADEVVTYHKILSSAIATGVK